jgi:photosystem II stability/assembly factor-like uncharacterized protein
MSDFRPIWLAERSLFIAIALALKGAPAAAALHWVPVGPPGNPAITAMAVGRSDYTVPLNVPPSLMYAATAGASVLLSPDGGNSWTDTGPGLASQANSLAVRQIFHMGVDTGSYDTTVFAATTNGGVFRLAPGASSWTASNSGLTNLNVLCVAVGGSGVVTGGNSGIVYAGTANGLFASTDGGNTWIAKTNGLPDASSLSVNAIATDPSSPSNLYLGAATGIFKSMDGGENWNQLDPVPGFVYFTTSLAVDPLSPSRLYANGAANPPCSPLCLPIAFLPVSLRSLDGGQTWTKVDSLGMNPIRAFAATPNLPARVFAGSVSNGVFESDDGGATWTQANSGLGQTAVTALVIDSVVPSFIFAGTVNGVFCSPLGQVNPTCVVDAVTLCLNGQRFRATVAWQTGGTNGNGHAYPVTDNTGAFWFFDPTNLELVVKVLDGRSVDGKFWVFYGSLTNVEFTLTVTDTLTGVVKTYFNAQGQLASVADTSAF